MAAEGGGLPEGPLDVGLQGRQVPPPPRPLRPPHEYSFPLLLLRRGRRALPRSLSPPPPPPPPPLLRDPSRAPGTSPLG